MFVEAHPDHFDLRNDLRYFGYWRTMDRRVKRDTWSHPSEFVDPSWDPGERAAVVEHLRAGDTLYQWLGSSTCRLCGLRPNGDRCLTDGTYAWPEGLAHYVEAHGVRVPDEIVRHVKAKSCS